MNFVLRGTVAASVVFVSSLALAQEAAPVAATATAPMVIGGAQQSNVLRAGTPVSLRLMTNLTTNGKHLKVGDRFALEVAEPVTLQGQTVIPVGAPAVGEVTSVRNKGMWGKSGNIETRLLYITANDRRIRLTGSVGDKGVKAGGGAVAVSALVFLPAGFFMTGTSAVIPPGTIVNGLLDEDIPVAFAAAAPVAMQVAAPAAVAAATAAPAPARASVIPVAAKAN